MELNNLTHYIKLSQNKDISELANAINNDKPVAIKINNENKLTDLIYSACYLEMTNHYKPINEELIKNYIQNKINNYIILINGKKTTDDKVKENDILLIMPRM